MTNTNRRYEPPAIDKISFSCPHCGALAAQAWHKLVRRHVKGTPVVHRIGIAAPGVGNSTTTDQPPRFAKVPVASSIDTEQEVVNVFLSHCYSCQQIAIWLQRNLIYPRVDSVPSANPDMPEEIRADFAEAGSILNLSPRGAAALLRLCVQKLCLHLGEAGSNLNADIGNLVAKGLDRRVQQALDIVRVVGNDAVHPGTIDLRDDHATAEKLFGLVNMIVDVMISQPKSLEAMFGSLPPEKLKQIEKRDGSK